MMKKLFNKLFRKSKVEVPNTPTEPKDRKFELIIVFRNQTRASYINTRSSKFQGTAVTAFIDFYKWYYHRESPCYTFRYDKGAEIFLRDQIVSIVMREITDRK